MNSQAMNDFLGASLVSLTLTTRSSRPVAHPLVVSASLAWHPLAVPSRLAFASPVVGVIWIQHTPKKMADLSTLGWV